MENLETYAELFFTVLEWRTSTYCFTCLGFYWFSCRYVHVVSILRFLWSVHYCPFFCLNRWLRVFYNYFDSLIFVLGMSPSEQNFMMTNKTFYSVNSWNLLDVLGLKKVFLLPRFFSFKICRYLFNATSGPVYHLNSCLS